MRNIFLCVRSFIEVVIIVDYVSAYICICIFTNTSARAGYDTRSIFKRSLTGLNSQFSFSKTNCHTKAENPCLSYNLPIARGRIIGFIPFPRVLMLCEMQSASSRIWTRVAVSISYDDNHYTMGTSFGLYLYMYCVVICGYTTIPSLLKINGWTIEVKAGMKRRYMFFSNVLVLELR